MYLYVSFSKETGINGVAWYVNSHVSDNLDETIIFIFGIVCILFGIKMYFFQMLFWNTLLE